MQKFSKTLQDEALEVLNRLGVGVILEDRVVGEDPQAKRLTLKSGGMIYHDISVSASPVRAW